MSTYQRKTQQEFPASEGWVEVQNGRDSPLFVMLEPFAFAHELAPGEKCFVLMIPDGPHPILQVSDDMLAVFCGEAIYQDNTEILDMRD